MISIITPQKDEKIQEKSHIQHKTHNVSAKEMESSNRKWDFQMEGTN